jgi:hypothetical protein
VPAQAGRDANRGFNSIDRCNDYLDRWRTRMAREARKGWTSPVTAVDGYCFLREDGVYDIEWVY